MKAINCLILLLLMTLKAQTQNVMTSSPYSMFGIGELQNGLYGQNAGMGGVAYGMRNNVQSPNQKIPDRKTKCVIKTHINIKQNVIFGAKLKPV